MRIVSTFARTGQEPLFMVFDTFADGRACVTAVVLSPDGQKVSEVGQRVLDTAVRYHDAHQQRAGGPQAGTHIVRILAASVARQRVVQVLGAVPDGSLVIFMCASDEVAATMWKNLGVERLRG